jgi:Family of unknown function (DUF6193)
MAGMRMEPDPAGLYPEVAAAGGLAAAIEKLAAQQGLTLVAMPSDSEPVRHARVASTAPGRQPLRISAWHRERKWSISGDGSGTGSGQALWLLKGHTDDLTLIPKVAVAWRDGAPLQEIAQLAPFAGLTGHYEVPDDSPAHLVASQWEYLRKDALDSGSPGHQELIEAAFAQPQLRQLYAFTSHWALRFSTVVPPGRANVADVEVSVNTIALVATSDGAFAIWESFAGPVLAEVTTATQAVAVAMGFVPSDLGPAVSPANAEELT